MQIYKQLLNRLSNLELNRYAGDLNALAGKDLALYNKLMESPVEVRVIAQRGICEDELYEICLSVQGKHKQFVNVRDGVIKKYTKIIKPWKKWKKRVKSRAHAY